MGNGVDRTVRETHEQGSSRRSAIAKLLLASTAIEASLSEQAWSAPCCTGSFQPDDIFAVSSLTGDFDRAQKGDLASTLRLGFNFYTGRAGNTDIPRARALFLVAAKASQAGAAWLGYVDANVHSTGGVSVRRRVSFQGLTAAANAGDATGQTLLGRVYERGLAGYVARPDKALTLYTLAAPKFALAKTLQGHLLVKSKNYKQAFSLFQEAAAAGETSAMVGLADLFSRMKRSSPESPEINRWLRTAGLKGDPVALCLHGLQLKQGTYGFSADVKRAVTLLHRAARSGNGPAQTALAGIYSGGFGGSNAPTLARFWARKASLPSLQRPLPPRGKGQDRPDTAS
jgi:TPR repeat protein